MSTEHGRRARKREATRQGISDVATRLFFERGFDGVTVDDIADAADVSRMTVFNHFPRKEDLFFDLDQAGRADLQAVLHQPTAGVSMVENLRLFAHRAVREEKPYLHFCPESRWFMDTIAASEALKARARAIRDELAQTLGAALSDPNDQGGSHADAPLIANLLVAVWAVAFTQAHETYRRTQRPEDAHAVFLALIDRGSFGLEAMVTNQASVEGG